MRRPFEVQTMALTILRISLVLIVFTSWSVNVALGQDYEIRDVTLIDGTGKVPLTHVSVYVKGNSVQAIQPSAAKPNRTAITVIDGTGKFLIPGLWDMHVHLSDIDEAGIPILVTYGITSVRDMGGDIERIKGWRQKIDSGTMVGPRVKFCGPMLEGEWTQKEGERTDHWAVPTSESARTTIDKLAKAGVDCIKMRTYKSLETYFALAEATKKAGIPLVGHAPWGIDPIQASDAGQRSFEHAFYPWPWEKLSAQEKRKVEDKFRTNGSALVPTLIAWQTFLTPEESIDATIHDVEGKTNPRERQVSPALRKNWESGAVDVKKMVGGNQDLPGWNKAMNQLYAQIGEMHAEGVTVMAGTDTGATMVFPGSGLLQELKLLVDKCQFTPKEALSTATIIPAKFFGIEDRLGTLETGKLADMVLLNEDPLADIANLRSIEGVMLNGRWLDQQKLAEINQRAENEIRKSYKHEKTPERVASPEK